MPEPAQQPSVNLQQFSQPQTDSYNQPEPAPVTVVKQPLKILFTWKARARPFKKRHREYYSTAGSIIFLICVILLFIKEFLAIFVLIAFAFLVYILSTVEPEEVEHKITSRGVVSASKSYAWEQLGRFWFEKKWTSQVLMIENFSALPPRIMMLIKKKDKNNLKKLLSRHLLFEKPEPTQMEKAGEWLQKKVPLETIPKKTSHRSHISKK